MSKIWKSILLVFILLLANNAWGQSRYALLIGIGDYPEGSGWNKIHGNNDISLIKSTLIRQGFSEESIMQLIDSAAIKNNILKAFDDLASRL